MPHMSNQSLTPEADSPVLFTFFLSGAKLETRRMMMIWARTFAAVIKSFFAVDFDFQWTKANLLRKGLDRNVECRRLLKSVVWNFR